MIFCFNINAKYNNCIGGTSYYLKPKVDVLFIISCLNAYCRPDLRPLMVTSVMGAANSPPQAPAGGGAPNFFPKEVCIFVTSLQHCFLQLIAISCNFLITMGWGCQTWGHWRWPWSRGAKTARRGGAPNFLRRKGACFLYIHSIYSITEVLQLGKKIQVLCSAYIDRRFFVVDRRFLM